MPLIDDTQHLERALALQRKSLIARRALARLHWHRLKRRVSTDVGTVGGLATCFSVGVAAGLLWQRRESAETRSSDVKHVYVHEHVERQGVARPGCAVLEALQPLATSLLSRYLVARLLNATDAQEDGVSRTASATRDNALVTKPPTDRSC